MLDSLGGIEATAFLRVGGETIRGVPEANADRATAEGKASVQFVHFPFTAEQIAALFSPNAGIVIGFSHRNYGHMAVLPEAVRVELTTDFGRPNLGRSKEQEPPHVAARSRRHHRRW